jgi:glycosyltransferase involved in cell wall biosynthesis
MNLIFIHPNYPAQFGERARHLAGLGHLVSVLTSLPHQVKDGVEILMLPYAGHDPWEMTQAAIEAVADQPVAYDAIVGHSGFLSVFPLQKLCPVVIPYAEFFREDEPLRPDLVPYVPRMGIHTQNAIQCYDVLQCGSGITPTTYQHDSFPLPVRDKLTVLHDGIDTAFWSPGPNSNERLATITLNGVSVTPRTRIVTYCSRGLESARLFDKFMAAAAILYQQRQDVVFVIVGAAGLSCYGQDSTAWTNSVNMATRGCADTNRFIFIGPVPRETLRNILRVSNCHVYLTADGLFSGWSLLDALACGAPVLASDVPAVREIVSGTYWARTDSTPTDIAFEAGRMLDNEGFCRGCGRYTASHVQCNYNLKQCAQKLLDYITNRRQTCT